MCRSFQLRLLCRPVYGDPSRNRVTGIRDGKRDCGQQIKVRCWDSIDARAATSTRLPLEILEKVAGEIIAQSARHCQRHS
jgi:GMP synthase PP-ATPase subunit